ncbi:hypothetical protein BBB56_06790 [Candidatus Pantoea deserta]|uniref:YokE-like PH domain-containing protein n=1 Tax=Candidatus Pantoea deserta TaxID=1869313 RepID=A0A3N4P6X7_9GAMM|nr:PH domain-containing protein [Pantoea deserta]RPE03098.1 hypothetical protein BBB56_06790 [Pantoea deserta]
MKSNKHVEKFTSSHLQANESVVSWAEGYIGNVMGSGKDRQYNGVLIVTDVRVAFYRKGFLGEVLENIPLKAITAIERKSMLGHRSVRIHTSHDALEFKTFSKEGETALINAIEAGRGLQKSSSEGEKVVAVEKNDPFEQLKKLSELKEAGILSEEEFMVKKQEIMQKI